MEAVQALHGGAGCFLGSYHRVLERIYRVSSTCFLHLRKLVEEPACMWMHVYVLFMK